MKPTRLILAVVIVSLLTTVALSATSYARGGRSRAHGTARSASPPDSLLGKELAVLTNQGISPARAAQALELQGRVGKSELVRKLQDALGAQYAGVWFDNANARLIVGATSAASAQTIARVASRAGFAGDVTIATVRSTIADLLAAQAYWNRRLAGLSESQQASTGIAPQNNALVITLREPARQRAAIEREAAASAVNVEVKLVGNARAVPLAVKTECNNFARLKAYCSPSITPGVTIVTKRNTFELGKGTGKSHKNTTLDGFAEITLKNVEPVPGNGVSGPGIPANTKVTAKPTKTSVTINNAATTEQEAEFTFTGKLFCTAGPLAIPKANKNERVLLTAGHCIEAGGGNGEEWFSFKRNEEELKIGNPANFVFGGNNEAEEKGDYGDIPIGAAWQTGIANNPVFAVTARWKKLENISYSVQGEQVPAVKQMTCHEGQTTGESCGEITEVNKAVNYEAGHVVAGLVVVEQKAGGEEFLVEGGDSGGPFIFETMTHELLMQGILSGGEGVAQPFHKAFFQPLTKVEGGPKGPLEKLNLELLKASNEIFLPEFTVETKLEGTFLKSKLNASGAEIKSSEGVINQSHSINTRLGEVTFWFKNSELGGKECHSEGDAEKSILVPGEWHVVPPFGRIALLMKATKIKCLFLSTSIEIVGGSAVVGKIAPTKMKTNKFTLEVNAPEKKQELTEFENNAGEKVKTALKLKINGGAEVTASVEMEKPSITTEKETELIES